EGMERKGGRLHKVICDVVAFANTNGGTVYVGLNANPKSPARGVENATEAVSMLQQELQRSITPPLTVSIDVQKSEGKDIVRVTVPKGPEPPYVIDAWKIYLRQESETSLAMRDEIVKLVQSTLPKTPSPVERQPEAPAPPAVLVAPPKTGVEIVRSEDRDGKLYHSMRDLRNNSVVHNVSRASARRLWRYAITLLEDSPVQADQVTWQGDVGFWKAHKSGGMQRYNLVQRDAAGDMRVYYGVTEDGIHGPWKDLVEGQSKT
ncbi:MAG: ATP-binding protein, partial [Chloroflexi bacterium]|nr:ATP-binding protein [Chloroflexota bacterium]